jgi:hypothetical protein
MALRLRSRKRGERHKIAAARIAFPAIPHARPADVFRPPRHVNRFAASRTGHGSRGIESRANHGPLGASRTHTRIHGTAPNARARPRAGPARTALDVARRESSSDVYLYLPFVAFIPCVLHRWPNRRRSKLSSITIGPSWHELRARFGRGTPLSLLARPRMQFLPPADRQESSRSETTAKIQTGQGPRNANPAPLFPTDKPTTAAHSRRLVVSIRLKNRIHLEDEQWRKSVGK